MDGNGEVAHDAAEPAVQAAGRRHSQGGQDQTLLVHDMVEDSRLLTVLGTLWKIGYLPKDYIEQIFISTM